MQRKDNKGQDVNKIEIEYMDLYEILSELTYNTQLKNPMGLHEFCNEQFIKYQPERSKREDTIKKIPPWIDLMSKEEIEFIQKCHRGELL